MKRVLQFLCFCLLWGSVAQAQIKLGAFGYVPGTSTDDFAKHNGSLEADDVNKVTSITKMTLSRGGGLGYLENSTYSYVGALGDGHNESTAVSNNVYYEVEVKSSANYTSFSGIKARLRTHNEAGSTKAAISAGITYRWYYSLNGTDFTPIGNEVLLSNTVTVGVDQALVDLSGITSLQNLASNITVYFRLYAWGANGGTAGDRGFGFGKSNASGLEVLSLMGSAFDYPVLAAWDLNGKNAIVSSNPVSSVASFYQNQDINVNSGVSVPLNIERGNGLNAGSLSGSFAMILKPVLPTSNVPSNLVEAKSNQAYYSIKFKGASTLYTNILGYKMKFRNGTSTIDTYAKYELLIGDNDNNISTQSPVYVIDDVPVKINKDNTSGTGTFFSKMLGLGDVSVIVPPDKNAELRIYIYATTSAGAVTNSSSVFGLGQYATGDASSVEIYGRLLTESEYQTLPVTLTSFKATKQSNSVRLNWVTASEQNNSYFTVLRAGDDKNFSPIGKVNGNGTTSTAKEYSLTDYKPLAGTNYYKLSQTDLDGTTKEIGEVQHVQFDFSNTSLTIIQQTEQSIVKAILNAAKADKANITIYNVSGNALYHTQLNLNSGVNEILAPVSLNKGVYILKVKTQLGETWQAKFVK